MPHGKLVIPEIFKQDLQQQKISKEKTNVGKEREGNPCLALLPTPVSSKNVTPAGTPLVPSLDNGKRKGSKELVLDAGQEGLLNSLPTPVSSETVSTGSTPQVRQLDGLANVHSVVSSNVDTDSSPPSPPPSPPSTPMVKQLECSALCSSIGDGDSTVHSAHDADDVPTPTRAMSKKLSTMVVSCHGEYTEVSLMTEEDGHVWKEDVGFRRLPSVTGVLQNDTEDELINPIRDLAHDLNAADVLITACSTVKSDVLDGVCDRMKFARFKRSVSAASKGDFVVMTKDDELRSVWCAVLKYVPEADSVLYLGKSVFGVAGHAYEVCREYKGDESLLHHVDVCNMDKQEGLLVVVEPLASLLHGGGLEYDEPYFAEDVVGAAGELLEPYGTFLQTALEKIVSESTYVQLNRDASWAVGAFVSHHEEPPPPPSA